MHDNNRYLRYQVYLNTIDQNFTPSLDDLTIGFSSGCVPSGQVFWQNISTNTYDLTVNKAGFSTASSSVSVVSGWQEVQVILNQ
jgi:hypothetical protein